MLGRSLLGDLPITGTSDVRCLQNWFVLEQDIERVTCCKSPWITAQLNGSSEAQCIMGLHSNDVHSKGLSHVFFSPLYNFSNGHKRRHETGAVKLIPLPPKTLLLLSKPAKWKHKRYQRIVNTHTSQVQNSTHCGNCSIHREKNGEKEIKETLNWCEN